MTTYILLSGLIVFLLMLLYLFRQKLPFKLKNKQISAFQNDIVIYLKQTYPNITFDLSIFNHTKNEKDIRVRQMLIAENLALQFAKYNFEFTTQKSIDSKLIWSSYEMESKPSKNKRPNDLRRRKEYTFQRDKEACIRCGTKLHIDDATLATIKSFGEGGSYHFENLATLCKDCYKSLKGIDPSSIAHDSKLLHDLIKKMHF